MISTDHGDIPTPIFMPVGTRGSVKTMWQEDLLEMDAKIILGNTYHLYLRPGHELIERVGEKRPFPKTLGGLHSFMSWDRPILTDSGGYQVFSLSSLNKVTDKGVIFSSHLDGSKHFIGPSESMGIQRSLGSDIVMAFDECPALPSTKEDLQKSMELTLNWAKICRDFALKPHQNLFGIIQGGLHLDLRFECMERLKDMDFEGYALGGLSVGEKNEEMVQFLNDFTHTMPEDKPRYLMGVGTPIDLLHGVRAGIDMFDCVLPSRNARNGQFLTKKGPLNIKKERFKEDLNPPDPECECKVCKRYTRAYVRHLFTVGEYLAGNLITYHNLHFYLTLMRKAREHILQGTFLEFYFAFIKSYESSEYNS